MEFYVGDKFYSFSSSDLDYMYIDEGEEGIVYRYFDQAFKIYKDYCRKMRLKEKDVFVLQKIDTNRIVLPKNLIYDLNHQFIGYQMDFLLQYATQAIAKMDIFSFIKEICLLRDDIFLLSDFGIDMEDLNFRNLLYHNGKIYLIDPGSYVIRDYIDRSFLQQENFQRFAKFVVDDILLSVVSLSKKNQSAVRNILNLEDSFSLIYRLEDTLQEGETVSSYVKRICK